MRVPIYNVPIPSLNKRLSSKQTAFDFLWVMLLSALFTRLFFSPPNFSQGGPDIAETFPALFAAVFFPLKRPQNVFVAVGTGTALESAGIAMVCWDAWSRPGM